MDRFNSIERPQLAESGRLHQPEYRVSENFTIASYGRLHECPLIAATDFVKLAVESASAAVDHAIECGHDLQMAKKEAGHGNWEALFERSNLDSKSDEKWRFAFNTQQAWKYMRAAKTPKLTRYLVKQGARSDLTSRKRGEKSQTDERLA